MNRRNLLGLLVTGGYAVHRLPGHWTRPVVDSVLLPAHAQNSPLSLAAAAGPTYEGPLPVARDATYTLAATTDHDIPSPGLFADTGFGPDNLGNPAATLVYFGSGSLPGTVVANTAGSAASLADGSLRVYEDGSWSLTGQPFAPGTYTFRYRLTNVNGSSDATVTLEIQESARPPVAADDLLTVRADTPGAGVLLAANGSGSDDPGDPPATLISFGGGSLGGTIKSNAAGATVALAGGALTIDAEGEWRLDGTPFEPGTYRFEYRLGNAGGTSDAAVTLRIDPAPAPPVAADDSFTFIAGTTLTGNVMSNNGHGADDRGNPAARLIAFGGGSLGGLVTKFAAGASAPLANGTLTLKSNGDLELTGASVSPGDYDFDYRLDNGVGTSDATVTLRILRRVS